MYQQNEIDMTNLTNNAMSHRDLLLMINDVDEPNFNVFSVAKEMMNSLKHKAISSKNYPENNPDLCQNCGRN